MSVLKLTQVQTFEQSVSSDLSISGRLQGAELVVYLTSAGDTLASSTLRLTQAEIKTLLPIFKELLELS